MRQLLNESFVPLLSRRRKRDGAWIYVNPFERGLCTRQRILAPSRRNTNTQPCSKRFSAIVKHRRVLPSTSIFTSVSERVRAFCSVFGFPFDSTMAVDVFLSSLHCGYLSGIAPSLLLAHLNVNRVWHLSLCLCARAAPHSCTHTHNEFSLFRFRWKRSLATWRGGHGNRESRRMERGINGWIALYLCAIKALELHRNTGWISSLERNETRVATF